MQRKKYLTGEWEPLSSGDYEDLSLFQLCSLFEQCTIIEKIDHSVMRSNLDEANEVLGRIMAQSLHGAPATVPAKMHKRSRKKQ